MIREDGIVGPLAEGAVTGTCARDRVESMKQSVSIHCDPACYDRASYLSVVGGSIRFIRLEDERAGVGHSVRRYNIGLVDREGSRWVAICVESPAHMMQTKGAIAELLPDSKSDIPNHGTVIDVFKFRSVAMPFFK